MSHALPPLSKNRSTEKERRDFGDEDDTGLGAIVVLEPLKKTAEGKAFFDVTSEKLRVASVPHLHSEESMVVLTSRPPHRKSSSSKRPSSTKKSVEPPAAEAAPTTEVPAETPSDKPTEMEVDSSWRRRIPLPPAVNTASSSASASPKSIQQRAENVVPSPPPAKAGRKETVDEFRRTLVASPPAKKADCSSPHSHSQLEVKKLKDLPHSSELKGRVEKADRFPAHPPKSPSPNPGRQIVVTSDASADTLYGTRPPVRDSASPIIYVNKTPPSKVKRRRDGADPVSPEKPPASAHLQGKKGSNISSHHLSNVHSSASDGSFTGGRLTALPSCDTSNLDNVSCLTISAAPQLCSYASNNSSLLL